MKKLFIFLMFALLLVGTASAWTDSKFVEDTQKINELNTETKYGTYTIEKSEWYDLLGIFGTAEVERELTLEKHTEECVNCESEIEITLLKEGKLIDDIRFFKQVNGNWQPLDFKNYKIQLKTESQFEERNVYENVCVDLKPIYNAKNGTSYTPQECSQVLVGKEQVELPEHSSYDINRIEQAGTYVIKLSAGKKPETIIDWQIKTSGIWTENWAVWGAVIGVGGVEANITINSPANNSVSLTKAVTTNASANVTGGAYLTNASLNLSVNGGAWEVVNTTNISTFSNYFQNTSVVYADDNTPDTIRFTWTATFTQANTSINYLASRVNALTGHNSRIKKNGVQIGGDYIPSVTFPSYGSAPTIYTDITIGDVITLHTADDADTGLYVTNFTIGTFGTYYTNYTIIFNNTFNAGDVVDFNYLFGDSDGDVGKSETRRFTIDGTAPTINLSYPTALIDYGKLNGTLELNFTATDTNLDSVWYDYNGTNVTIAGATSGEYNISNITLSSKKNVTICANDTAGNEYCELFGWDYKVFENSRTYNVSTFETKSETFSVNFTAENPSLPKFIYNGTTHTATLTSNGNDSVLSHTIDIPLGVGTNSFYFAITVNGTEIQLDSNNQQVNLTFFTQTNATYPTKFLNITFKDENDLESINASIPNSEFVYYLGSGSVNKTLTFANNTDNFFYSFSGTTGSLPLYVEPLVQYRRVNDYPQRIWEPSVRTYNNITTNQTLYLLNTNDGIFVTYQVITPGESPIPSVQVVATRQVGSETVQVGSGLTDSAGTITFWLNPDFQHTVTFNKEGYDEVSFTHFPTQSAYTITMGGGVVLEVDCGQGILQTVRPSSSFLYRNQLYDFSYTISSSYYGLSNFYMNLSYSNGTHIGSLSSSSSAGGTLELEDINVSNSSNVIMVYSYQVDNSECSLVSGTRVWITQTTEGTEFSIWALVQDTNTYLSQGLYGFDNFGKALISFLVIVLMVGTLSQRYGIVSEGAIMGILFGIVFFLDVGLGFIPAVEIGTITSIEHFFTYITFLILIMFVLKEETR